MFSGYEKKNFDSCGHLLVYPPILRTSFQNLKREFCHNLINEQKHGVKGQKKNLFYGNSNRCWQYKAQHRHNTEIIPVLFPGEIISCSWQFWPSAVQVYRVKFGKQGPADSHVNTHSLWLTSAGIVALYLWQPKCSHNMKWIYFCIQWLLNEEFS